MNELGGMTIACIVGKLPATSPRMVPSSAANEKPARSLRRLTPKSEKMLPLEKSLAKALATELGGGRIFGFTMPE